MRKWILWGSLTLGVLVLLAPLLMGFALEQFYGQAMAKLNQDASSIQVTGAFKRGLYSSSLKTQIDFLDEQGAVSAQITLGNRVLHGPLPLAQLAQGRIPWPLSIALVETRYQTPSALSPLVGASNGGGLLIRGTTVVYWDRSLRGQLHIDPSDLTGSRPPIEASEGRFDWNGSDHLAVQFDLGAISRSDENGSLLIEPSKLRAELTLSEGAQSALAELELGELSWEAGPTGKGTPIQLRGLIFEQLQSVSAEGLFELEANLSVDSVVWQGATWGPGLARVRLDRLDLGGLAGLRKALEELARSAPEADDSGIMKAQVLAEWLPRILGHSPQIALDELRLESNGESLQGHVQLEVDTSDPGLFENPLFAFLALRADAELWVPAPLFESAIDRYLVSTVREDSEGMSEADLFEMALFMREAMIMRLNAEAWVVPEEKGYRLGFQLEDGLPMLNGTMIDPQVVTDLLPSP